MKTELLNYYRQINRPGKALSYCWPDMEEIGLGDPAGCRAPESRVDR